MPLLERGAAPGWRIHGSVEDTKLSTNKQHSLSSTSPSRGNEQSSSPNRGSEQLCIPELHGKADRHMKLLTIEREISLGTLWDQEQCTQFCSKDELWEATKEEEMKIPWKEVQEGLPVPKDQYQERFCWLRLNGVKGCLLQR